MFLINKENCKCFCTQAKTNEKVSPSMITFAFTTILCGEGEESKFLRFPSFFAISQKKKKNLTTLHDIF